MGINRLPPKINRSIIIFLEKRRRLQLPLPFRVSRKRLILLRIEEEKKFFLSILNNLRHARARKGREQQVQSKGVDRSTAGGAGVEMRADRVAVCRREIGGNWASRSIGSNEPSANVLFRKWSTPLSTINGRHHIPSPSLQLFLVD